ncbi:NDNF (Neuron Derived Neurotrophic Factor)-like protein [Aphelenchoides besseyi]|nr:NDNF (Neuron Derived Neurotrophic Factor)-like protein [Aphelenchoides besseyi]
MPSTQHYPKNATVDYSLSTKDNETFEVRLNWFEPEQWLDVKDRSKHRFCVLVSMKQPHHAICDEPNDDIDSMHCTKQTFLRIPNLRPNHRYYATVHLHNQKSGGSSAYHPIEFRTPELNKKTSNEDSLEIKGLTKFVINESEHLQVSVINDDRVPVDYWIWMSRNFQRSPYANLPEDRSIRSLSRSCNSVLLEWSRVEADENLRYCVHQQESRPDYFAHVVHERTQMCFAEMNVGRKAVCFYSNETEPLTQSHFILSDVNNYPMQTSVKGLRPSTTYRLDVSAQRIDLINSQPLSYRPLFIRTLDKC